MKDLISFENIPESLKTDKSGLLIAEVKDKVLFGRLVKDFAGVIFSTTVDNRHYIKMSKKYYRTYLKLEC